MYKDVAGLNKNGTYKFFVCKEVNYYNNYIIKGLKTTHKDSAFSLLQ